MKLLSPVFVLSLLITLPLSAKTILIIGDSLSASYGIAKEKSWVKLLEDKVREDSKQNRVVNLSTSGDTTSNGLAKLPHALESYQPQVVIIELGANDGLRGLALPAMKSNLSKMVTLSQQAGACVLLLATQLPPNYGVSFLSQFQEVFNTVAEQHQITFVPMFLDGVAGNPKYMQEDGLHPNELAQAIIFANVWPYLTKLNCNQ
jgi:acyl-CoA thioesterase-1